MNNATDRIDTDTRAARIEAASKKLLEAQGEYEWDSGNCYISVAHAKELNQAARDLRAALKEQA